MAEAVSCLLAEVTFSSYYLGVRIRDYGAFSASLLPFSYCPQRCLTNSHVLYDCLPVTTVSGLKKDKKTSFQRIPLQDICSARVDFTGILIPGSTG